MDVRVISDVARFRAGTGIIGVPTVMLIDERGRGRAFILGALERAGAARLEHLLRSGHVDAADGMGMSVEYGGAARAILADPGAGSLEGSGQGDRQTEIQP